MAIRSTRYTKKRVPYRHDGFIYLREGAGIMSYFVYELKDYKGFTFYVGMTKNLELRIKEHEKNKNATPAKTYRVRRTITVNGYLPYDYHEFDTKEEAVEFEAKLIEHYKYQLVNKTHGRVKKESTQRRTKGRAKQCPHCGNWFRKINAHKCKMVI